VPLAPETAITSQSGFTPGTPEPTPDGVVFVKI
jgi:hypothetical protein